MPILVYLSNLGMGGGTYQQQQQPEPGLGSGGSGKRYAPPAWWGDEKKKKKKRKELEDEVVVLQKKIEVKRHEIYASISLERIERLIEQITSIQWRILDLLARIDEMNKEVDLAEDEEAIVAYIAHRMLH